MTAAFAPFPAVVATPPAKAATGTMTLLVPTDFSELAQVAVDTTLDLADRYRGIKLVLLHVVARGRITEYPDDDASLAASPAMAPAEARRRLDSMMPRGHASLQIDTRVLEGDPAREICELAQAQHVQAIVLSSHGASKRPGNHIGSVAELVVQRAGCPVLVIRPQKTPTGQFSTGLGALKFRRILVGYDHRRGSKRALAAACALARMSRATLTLVHALAAVVPETNPPHGAEEAMRTREAREWLRRVAAKRKSAAQTWIVTASIGAPWEVILDAAATNGSDLIIVGPHEHTRWGHCFVGSTAQRVVHFAPCSVLALK